MQKFLSPWLQRYFSSAEAIGIVITIILSAIALSVMSNIIAPIVTSLVIAYVLATLVRLLQKARCPHLLAVMVVFIFFIGSVLLILLWLLPLLWDEVTTLFAAVPEMFRHGQRVLLDWQAHYPAIISANKLEQLIGGLNLQVASFSRLVWAFSLASLNGALAMVVYLVLVPLLVFFFLKDGDTIRGWLIGFLPHERAGLTNIWRETSNKIGSYVKGKVVEMFIVMFASVVTFSLLGLQYSILLGTLVGLSVFIPYVGVVLATIPLVIVALLQWGWSAQFVYLMAVYAVIVTLDANILVPMLFAEAMDLHPIAIILSVLICGSLGGFWGVFFAIPFVAFCNVLINHWPKSDL